MMKAVGGAIVCAWALMWACVGCEAPELPASATAKTAPAAPAAEEKPVELVAGIPGPPLPEIEVPVTDVPRKFTSHDPIKGRRSRDAGGSLGAIGGARFHIEYQTIINNIDYALKLWEAEHGSYPKSHEEFWKVIIEANGAAAKPPEIEPQHEYIYVPEQATMGLQIRLKPGGPGSSLPPPAAGQEHVYQPPAPDASAVDATAGQPGADQPTTEAAEPASTEPSPSIRTRAEQLGAGRELPTE